MTWRGGASLVDAGFWRLRARHAVPLLGKRQRRKERCRGLGGQWGSWCGVLLAQAGMPVLLEGEENVIAREKKY